VEENVEKARALVHAGAKEIRITGQDTGVYGWDRNQGESLLPELLDRICTEIDGDFRVQSGDGQSQRESTASARNWPSCSRPTTNCTASCTRRSSLEATPLAADMRRQHEVGEYVEVVETFDDRLDYWTLSTDFIVGFPTEDDHDFQQTMALLRETRPGEDQRHPLLQAPWDRRRRHEGPRRDTQEGAL